MRDNYYISFTKLFKKKFLPLYQHSVILSPIAGFLSLVQVTQFSQFEKGIFCPLSYVHQMEVFSAYFITIKPYI